MSKMTNQSSVAGNTEQDIVAPSRAYIYSAMTFLTVFGLIAMTLWFVPSRLLAFLAVDGLSFRAIAVLTGLVLGVIAGIQTWNGCMKAHASRVKFERKLDQLHVDYGRNES